MASASRHSDASANRTSGSSAPRLRELASVRLALEAGDLPEAVRRFVQVHEHRPSCGAGSFMQWLTSGLGRSGAEALIDAFARHACFFCKGGRQRCPSCEGGGVFERGYVCDPCVGTGASRCDFCDGTGWVTLDYVPQPLRAAVLMRRAAIARARIAKLLAQPPLRVAGHEPGAVLKAGVQLLFAFDRQMGVLENTLTSGDLLGPLSPAMGQKMKDLTDIVVRSAIAACSRNVETLQVLAAAAAAMAAAAGLDSPKHKFALRRSRYYESLSKAKSWVDTGLHHPFLAAALARCELQAFRPAKDQRATHAA